MKTILTVLRRQRRGHPLPIWRRRARPGSADLRLARAALPDAELELRNPWDEEPVPARGERVWWET
jgi:hypothetical protein